VISQIPFHVPLEFLAGIQDGSLIRFGGLLKDASSGQIVAHLQESSVAHSLLSEFASIGMSPLSLGAQLGSNFVDAGSGIYTAIQVAQLKSMLEFLQVLQFATLGVSMVGVGVTLGGFLYMRGRLNTLDQNIQKLSVAIHLGFEEVQKARLRRELAKVNNLIENAKLADTRTQPTFVYNRIADAMSEQASFFEQELRHLMKDSSRVDMNYFWELSQLFILCNGTVIDCRMRANELPNARAVSEAIADKYREHFDLLHAGKFQGEFKNASMIVKTLRDVTDGAITKPYLIQHLIDNKIDGPSYFKRLDEEKQQPLLLLTV
jgi:hypothetical protein